MTVSSQHKDYTKYLPRWELARDSVEGAPAIKSRNGGKTYLPQPNAEDTRNENNERYKSYLTRANYVNFVGHTKKGMIGMVFRKEMFVELPSELEYLEKDFNGGGLSLEQSVRSILGDTIETARFGLLVDFPETDEETPKTKANTADLKSNILSYRSEAILNWRTGVFNGNKKLILVVLKEEVEEIQEDGFSVDVVDQYRVLRLNEGVYTQQLYDKNEEPKGPEVTPTKSDKSKWDTIPFQFVGAQNNDESVDDAPLYAMAEVNISHYRNSADYEESSFMVGQPTPWASGLTQGWVDEVLKGSVALGSRAFIALPEGGEAGLLQAEPNTMPFEGMKHKEEQMIKIGARIIQDNSGVETAEAAKIRFAGQTSELASIVGNIESALTTVIEWAGFYMGVDGEALIELNRQFYDITLDAQQVMAMIQLSDIGVMDNEDIQGNLKRANWIDSDKKTNDAVDNLENKGIDLSTP